MVPTQGRPWCLQRALQAQMGMVVFCEKKQQACKGNFTPAGRNLRDTKYSEGISEIRNIMLEHGYLYCKVTMYMFVST